MLFSLGKQSSVGNMRVEGLTAFAALCMGLSVNDHKVPGVLILTLEVNRNDKQIHICELANNENSLP